jgi:hypothetical protein
MSFRHWTTTAFFTALVTVGAIAAAQGQKPAPAKAAPLKHAAGEWLALCSKCASPLVTSSSGLGTAKAVAEARMTRDLITGENGLCEPTDNACIQTELRKVYRATADCTAGRITPVDEKTYTLAGLWDDSDIGAGRTKWKDAQGQVVGRDNASGGLGISQQWEVLCPGPVSAATMARATGVGTTPKPAAGAAAQASVCTGQRHCDEVASFAALITDFRPSVYDQNTRVVSATVRFQNKTNRPIVLGYVRNASVAIDEQGNRYTINDANQVRGIGEIAGASFDPKFTLQPGEASDARFEYAWRWDGRAIIGQRAWDIDLTVREVNEVAPGQYRFGAEHPLQFKGVSIPSLTTAAPAGAPGRSAMPTTAATPVAQPASQPAAPAVPAPEADACAGKPGCYDAGPFVAELVGVNASKAKTARQWHIMSMNIRFRNKTNQPMILGYVSGTGVLIDELGNRYGPSAPPADAKGIGRVQARSADPQFVLGPGQTRAATFGQQRAVYGNSMVIGSKFSFDVSIAQLEVLYNGQQVRTVREYSMTFPEFGLGGVADGAAAPPVEGITDAAKKLRGIFQRKPPIR